MTQTTLVFLRRDGEILLAMKKRGFGAGRWNGAGGKLDRGETFGEAAAREVQEEIGVTTGVLTEVAKLMFYMDDYDGDPIKNVECIVYLCEDWAADPAESEEMAPQWFALSAIPYPEMWPDDIYWLPEVLAGKYVEAEFWFAHGDVLRDMKLLTKPLLV